MKLKPRPDLYYRLMDIVLIIFSTLIVLRTILYSKFVPWDDISQYQLYGTLYPILLFVWDAVYLLWPFAYLVAIFLILASFMRDEFAEEIWQRTATSFVRVVIVVTPIIMFIMAYFQYPITDWYSARFDPLDEYRNSRDAEFTGMAVVVYYTAALSPFLFICIYRWHRWRAGP